MYPIQAGGHRFSEAVIKRIEQAIALDPRLSRRQLSRQVCEWMHLRSANGKLQEMSCRAALLKLHRGGRLHLPPARPSPAAFASRHRVTAAELPEGATVECALSQLGPVELVVVGSQYSQGVEALAGAFAALPSAGGWAAVRGAAALFDPQPPARVAGRPELQRSRLAGGGPGRVDWLERHGAGPASE